MPDTIYIEQDIVDHPRTLTILERFPRARRITCERYGQVFNPRAQNFRLQKRKPALILARKHDGFVLPAPTGYGVGGQRNYYFSHMLNCPYDCRYCFLQGMYRSAHQVLFVNYEDFEHAIADRLRAETGNAWFFSGYDCDSLAYEPVSRFAQGILPLFARNPDAWLELRTKSVQIRGLLATVPLANVVVAFSFTPEEISRALEHGAPSVPRRIEAMVRLQQQGWRLGLRFDPLIYQTDYEAQYERLFEQIFAVIDPRRLHSVSLGPFRLPRAFFRTLKRLYPDEPLLASPLSDAGGMISYRPDLEQQMTEFCTESLLRHIPRHIFFPCTTDV